jgi:hypothetical protein
MRIRLVSLMLLLTAGSGVAVAHHSYAEYDRTRAVTIEGVLEQLKLGNPHAILLLRTDEGTLITAEWGNANMVTRTGFLPGMLNVGDRVAVTGSPTKDPAARRVSLLTQIERMRDGWKWTKQGVVAGAAAPAQR